MNSFVKAERASCSVHLREFCVEFPYHILKEAQATKEMTNRASSSHNSTLAVDKLCEAPENGLTVAWGGSQSGAGGAP